jgi:hypothetical protein
LLDRSRALKEMTMRPGTLMTALLCVASITNGAEACGDKFLRVGRGARYQRGYVAVHPATLLLVARSGSPTAAALLELEPALKRAGHKPVVVESTAAVTPALSGGRFHLVLADMKDLPAVETAAKASGATVDFLPFLDRPTSAARAAAEQGYRCVAETPGKKMQVLAEIDDLMEIVLKGTGETNRKRP